MTATSNSGILAFAVLLALIPSGVVQGDSLRAGAAEVDITDRSAGPVNDPLYAKALVLKSDAVAAVLITIDAVAIGEIGRIGNDFLPHVRSQLQKELAIPPENVLINASHCHGAVRSDTAELAVRAVKDAWQRLTPVRTGVGTGHEDRISENRRLMMRDGSEVDMRRAYAMPPDADVADVGPIDPEIGLLRLDREDGSPLAVVYNFACHPIMGAPSGGNTAGFPGFASAVIEEGMGKRVTAFFIQGCAGDVNPVRYKDVASPPDAESLGNRLGISVLRAVKQIETRESSDLKIVNDIVELPRGSDLERRIAAIRTERTQLVESLRPTNINFETFLPLLVQHKLSPDFSSYYSQGYLHDKMLGKEDLARLDAVNRTNVETYLKNIRIMEELTRLNTNLALIEKHLATNRAAETPTLDVEVVGLRVGEFRMVTFPGELSVQIGLNIKKAALDSHTFVAGYTNGYIYYAPTAKQRNNTGYAQEDCDCLLAPQWQKIFEERALKLLDTL